MKSPTRAAAFSRRVGETSHLQYDDFDAGELVIDCRGDGRTPVIPEGLAVLGSLGGTDYSPLQGDAGLRALIGEYFGLSADRVVVTSGGTEGLMLTIAAATDPGTPLLVPRPSFPGHYEIPRLLGAHPVPYDECDLSSLTGNHEPVLVCNPSNPTGRLIDPAVVPANERVRIWDACHGTIVDGHLSGVPSSPQPTDLVVFSFSKLLTLHGIRCGFVYCGSDEAVEAILRAKLHLSMATSDAVQQIIATILRWPGLKRRLDERREALHRAHQRIDAISRVSKVFGCVASQGGSHTLLNAKSATFDWSVLVGEGVQGVPGYVFNAPRNSVRLSLAQPTDKLERLFQRLEVIGRTADKDGRCGL